MAAAVAVHRSVPLHLVHVVPLPERARPAAPRIRSRDGRYRTPWSIRRFPGS
ncbi:hypothetical protein [Rhodococcus opacus]|uniref:hypothetical protein n=1 Tax=Rhodococcus opacus TaxID=37919 RepID=UPI003BB6CFCE